MTTITHYPLKTTSKNYREILVDPPWDWDANVNMSSYFTRDVGEGVFFKISSLWNFGLVTTKFFFDSPVVKKFIEEENLNFDLVISEQFQQEALNVFSYKYNCPLIVIGTLDYAEHMHHAKGQITPWSHVPHFFSYSTEKMSFLERTQNIFFNLYDVIGRKFYYYPKVNGIAREAFKNLENQRGGKLPSVEELEKKISVHLMNSHSALSYPRPKMPGMIDIAGVHIKPTKPLPNDIQEFLDGAENGAILISFGTFLNPSLMPPHQYNAMVSVLSKLKQRILWKWEDENTKFPQNIMAKKWIPQADILAHKNVKLYIGHGGIFGIQEAIWYAKPIIVFPSYGDQHQNGHKVERDGIGLLQSMKDITAESFMNAVQSVLSNATIYENVKMKSEIFRSNQNTPLDNAIWWIEYVIKFKGAPHIQSAARDMSWFRYLSLDIAFVIFGAIYTIYDLINQAIKKKIPDEKTEKTSNKKSDNKKKKTN